jgi:uncharacterized membrane protein YdjX (TVP38/TMEM64 family)
VTAPQSPPRSRGDAEGGASRSDLAKKPARRVPWRALLLAAAVVALFLASRVLPVERWLAAFQRWTIGLGFWAPVIYGAVYVVAAVLLVPGALLTIGAGLLFGAVRGTVLVVVSATTAAALAFLVARHLARERVERWAARNPRFQAIDAAIREQGWKVVALLRLSPLVPFSVSNYLYGLTAVRFWPYVLASAIGMVPGTLLYVSIGAAGRAAAGAGGRSPLEWALLGLGLAATAAATVLVGRAARRQLRKRHVAETA